MTERVTAPFTPPEQVPTRNILSSLSLYITQFIQRNKYDISTMKVPPLDGETTSEVMVSIVPADLEVSAPIYVCCVVDISGG